MRTEARPVWLFTAVLLALAAAGYTFIVAPLPPHPASIDLPWPLLALGFFGAEANALVVHFRRESHSFTVSEIPVVIGLFFVDPSDYVLALLVGSALALVVVARQSPVKAAFNLANYAFLGIIQLGIFHAIADAGAMPGPREWAATFASTISVAVVGAATIAAAISLSGGASQFRKLPDVLKFAGATAVANTSLGLLAVSLAWRDPQEIWLLVVPLGVLVLAYRSYVSEREKHERLELLYQSSSILQRSPELDSALVALLVHARGMFRAEIAEIVLYSRSESGNSVRTTSLKDGRAEVMVPLRDADDRLHERIPNEPEAFFFTPSEPFLRGGTAIQQAIVSPLTGDSGLIGWILIANRITEGTSFDDDDRRLLGTIANQTAVALENGQLEQSLAELSRLKEQLRYQAYHDPLTGLANRTLFADRVDEQLGALEGDRLCAVLFLDLDDFKLVNDTLGHAAGDRVLNSVAERIKQCIRNDDVAARLGGDEFGVLVVDEAQATQATAVAHRIVEALEKPMVVAGQEFSVAGSIGIAVGRGPGTRSDELLRNADVAMYTAKAAGKRRVAVFDPIMHAAIVARHSLSAELSRSVGRHELDVRYQPIVELRTGGIVGAEALVRWNHPVRGLVGPDEFIPLAEETGAILSLGPWVLAEACREAAAWLDQPSVRGNFSISVNISPIQLQQPEFVDGVEQVLKHSGLPASKLILEMTETAMFQDAHATVGRLQALREKGVRIAIDDFGTGYSSLSYIRRFPVDVLKIARDFIVGGDRDASEWAFAHSILALGQTLGLDVVAEGIEEAAQAARLRQLGCTFGQGFYFGRPMLSPEFSALLAAAAAPSGGVEGETALALAKRVVEVATAEAARE